MKNALLYLYTGWVFAVFFALSVLFLPFMTVCFMFGTRLSFLGYHIYWLWSWLLSKLLFVRYVYEGLENIKEKSYIYVSNHTSFLDPPGLRMAIKGEFRAVAKKELTKIPVFGFIVKGSTIVVDRSNAESRANSIKQMIAMLDKGISILIFAEGTQNRTKEPLQPFKDGAFRIAVETQKKIIPMTVIGAAKLMPPRGFPFRPGVIKVKVGKEIDVAGLTSKEVSSLKEKTYQAMLEMLTQNRQLT